MLTCPELSDICAFRPGYFSGRGSNPIDEGQICHPRGRESERKHWWGRRWCASDYIGNRSVKIRECETTALYLLENGLGFLVFPEACGCGHGPRRTVVAVCRC